MHPYKTIGRWEENGGKGKAKTLRLTLKEADRVVGMRG